ncbi:MAG: metalloregulator ArsR/SmtB family transcription factor [Archaeoglobaceae archaeon]
MLVTKIEVEMNTEQKVILMASNTSPEEILKVLGNESRRKILRLLSKKPCYTSEISYCLKMAPKVVQDHLEKLENIGIVRRYEEGRRRYYTINRNLRIEVSITPHRFNTSVNSMLDERMEIIDREIEEMFRNFKNVRRTLEPPSNSLQDIYRALQEVEEVERSFSELMGIMSHRFNQMYEELLDTIEEEIEDEQERLVLLGIAKGASTPSRIIEEFGISYDDVVKSLKNLKRKGLVEEEEADEIIWKIRC